MNKKLYFLGVSLILLVLFLWTPWISKDYARMIVQQKFTDEWQGVSDGCGFNCNDCGVKDTQRTIFGVNVKIEYACGMLPSDSSEYHINKTIFVSLLGTVHGLPRA